MQVKSKLVVLSDNRYGNGNLLSEHGLSVFVDTGKCRLLLDTGASDGFIHNAEQLGIDLKTVDFVFVSHGHRDHLGGLAAFLDLNSKAKVILSRKIPGRSFYSNRNGNLRDIGLAFDWESIRHRCQFVDRPTHLSEDLFVFPCDCRTHAVPKANRTLYREAGQGLEPDDFDHELVLGIGTDDILLYTGCAHNGLLNILNSFATHTSRLPDVVLGGFHLLDSQPGQVFETQEEISRIGAILKADFPDTVFMTGHCTGTQAADLLSEQLGQQLEFFHAGFQASI